MMILDQLTYTYDGNRLTAFMPVYLQGAANTLTDDDDREVLRRRYCGNFIYEDGILQCVLVEGGFITFSNGTPQYHFYIKDHLGSNRVVTDANGNIEEYNHYPPYGALMGESSASTQPYKYNSKELNRLNRLLWYDQSARQYNPILGRFMSMDPLCEKYYSISPYAFCANNPVKYVDPTGKFIMCKGANGTFYRYTQQDDGTWSFVDNVINKVYNGGDTFVDEVVEQFNELSQGDFCSQLLDDLATRIQGTLIWSGSTENDYFYESEFENPRFEGIESQVHVQSEWKTSKYLPGATKYTSLGYEMAHSLDRLKGTIDASRWTTTLDDGMNTVSVPEAEKYATFIENGIRAEHHLPLRVYYSYGSDGPDLDTQILGGRTCWYIYADKTILKGSYNIGNHKKRYTF